HEPAGDPSPAGFFFKCMCSAPLARTPGNPLFARPQRLPMSYVVAILIALFGGGWVAATEKLFRVEERPGLFRGTPGMLLLLVATGAGGLLLAGAVVWVARLVPNASVALIIAIGSFVGAKASNMLHVTAAGAANRMLVGLLALTVLYGIAWPFFPV